MREDEATRVAQALVERGVIARVARPAAYRFGVRVPLGDGREALWDVDGAAGLEAQIEAAETALRAVEDELSDPSAWATPEASARSTARHEEAKLKVAELYERWEAVAG